MRIFAFAGRVLVSTLFIMSGVTKFTSYDSQTGGPMVSAVESKMECFLNSVEGTFAVDLPSDVVKVQPLLNAPCSLRGVQENYGNLILAAGALEVVGGLLFILDFSIGAMLLV